MREQNVSVRRKKRYDHVSISLRLSVGDEWKWIKALDWNEDGLNFYLDHEVQEPGVVFRKTLAPISGDVVWGVRNDDDVVLEMALNKLLFGQIRKHGSIVREHIHRIVRLIRTHGMVNEKMKLLSALGLNDLSGMDAHSIIDGYGKDCPRFRYGVKCESVTWNELVRQALETSSAALLLDRISEDLSGMLRNPGHPA